MKALYNIIMESRHDYKLVQFESWKHMQNVINRYVGWEKMTLYEPYVTNHAVKDEKRGFLHMNIDDPRKGDSIYVGFKVDGQYVGFTNIYLDDPKEFWIGDFEIIADQKGKGYGHIFYDMLEEKYKGGRKEAILYYHGNDAKEFWRSVGFNVTHGCAMYKQIK